MLFLFVCFDFFRPQRPQSNMGVIIRMFFIVKSLSQERGREFWTFVEIVKESFAVFREYFDTFLCKKTTKTRDLLQLTCESIGTKLWFRKLSRGRSKRSFKVMAAQHKRSWKLRKYCTWLYRFKIWNWGQDVIKTVKHCALFHAFSVPNVCFKFVESNFAGAKIALRPCVNSLAWGVSTSCKLRT